MSTELAKPAAIPDWATNAGGTIATPPGGKIATGWVAEKPPFQFWNWLHYYTSLWIRYFQAKNDILPGASAETNLVMVAGVIVPTQGLHTVTPSLTQELVAITPTNFNPGRIIEIKAALSNYPLIVKDESGTPNQLFLKDQKDAKLFFGDSLTLQLSPFTTWIEVGRKVTNRQDVTRAAFSPVISDSLGIKDRGGNFGSVSDAGVPFNTANIVGLATDGKRVISSGVNGGSGLMTLEMFEIASGGNNTSPINTTKQGVTGNQLIFDGKYLWSTVWTGVTGFLTKSDIYFQNILANIAIAGRPTYIAVDTSLGNVWVADNQAGNVKVYDRETNALLTTIAFFGVTGVCADGNSGMFVFGNGAVKKYSTNSFVLQSNVATPGTVNALEGPCAFDGVTLWASDQTNKKLNQFDAGGNWLASYTFGGAGGAVGGMCFDGRLIWATVDGVGVFAIECQFGTLKEGPYMAAIASWGSVCFDGRHVWVSDITNTLIRRIIPYNSTLGGSAQ